MPEQNGYHANIQDSLMLHRMGECMQDAIGDYQKGVAQGNKDRIFNALSSLRTFMKVAEGYTKSMVEGSRKEESIQPLEGGHYAGE